MQEKWSKRKLDSGYLSLSEHQSMTKAVHKIFASSLCEFYVQGWIVSAIYFCTITPKYLP